jgi:hypothetical protein
MLKGVVSRYELYRSNCVLIQWVTLTMLTWRIWRAPTNASKWQMGFNSAFKGLKMTLHCNKDIKTSEVQLAEQLQVFFFKETPNLCK